MHKTLLGLCHRHHRAVVCGGLNNLHNTTNVSNAVPQTCENLYHMVSTSGANLKWFMDKHRAPG
eukprot:2798111-Amphidinium_carterae.1